MEDLKLKISLDSSDAQSKINKTSAAFKNLKSNVELASHSLQAFTLLKNGISSIATEFLSFAKNTLSLNSSLEDLTSNLQGLIAANSENVTSTGEVIDMTQKWAMSGEAANETMKKLKQTARKTASPLSDLSNGFSMFYATAANQGGLDEAYKAFNSLAMAAKVAGKDMGSLVPMFDSLASGSVVAGSEMGAFMRIVGLTNEELKRASNSGELFDFLNEKLSKFGSLASASSGNFSSALASLKSEFESLSAELGKPIFGTFKSGMQSALSFLSKNHDALLSFGQALGSGAKHLGIFGAAIISVKAANLALTSASNAAKIALYSLELSFKSGASAAGVFNIALNTLKTTFKTFLPTAIVFGAFELLINYFNRAKAGSDALRSSLALTSAEIYKMSAAQRQNEILKISSGLNDLNKEKDEIWRKLNGREMGLLGYKEKASGDEKTRLQARYDEIIKIQKEASDKIKALNSQKKDLGELKSGAKLATKEENNTALIAKTLKDREHYYLDYYEKTAQSAKAWAIKEKELRANLSASGIDENTIEKIVVANKNAYLNKFNAKLGSSKIKAPKIEASDDKDIEALLRKQLEYYKAIGDKEGELRTNKQITTNHLKELGLNEYQMAKYFSDLELKNSNENTLIMLNQKERYFELLGQKQEAAHMRDLARLEELRQKGASQDQSANAIYGNEARDENYSALYSSTGINEPKNELESKLNAIDEFQNAEIERINQYYALKEQNEANHQAKLREIQRTQMQAKMAELGVGFDTMASLAKTFYEMSGGQNKTAMRAYQAMMVGKAIVNTYTAASNAYASAGNPILGAAMAAMAIAQGMAQVAQIKAQKFHTGGMVGGGDLRSDEVNAVLLKGEYVLNREQAKQMKQNANSIANSEPNYENSAPVIINTLDNSVIDQWANTRGGRKVLKNIINADD